MKKTKSRNSTNNSGLLPSSFRIISSCLKTVSANASTVASSVRSAGVSVATSISAAVDDHKDQVIWAGFDKLEFAPSSFKHVLLVGYQNGFQVLDVDDASNFSEVVSKRDGPVTFLQMQRFPETTSHGVEGFRASHPLLLLVAGDDANNLNLSVNHRPMNQLNGDGCLESPSGNFANSSTEVRFYSIKSNSYVHVLRFRSAVYMVRCSPRIVAVGLATQIYCFDALTLENKFSVLTYPVPELRGQGSTGVNIGYGPMAVGPRWLAYASNNPLVSNTGRISSKNLSSPGVSPSTSPGSGSLVARYAMESSRHFATGIMTLGDKGYKSLSRYYKDMLPDGSSSPVSSSSGWKVGGFAATETDNAGMVVVKDCVSRAVISQFKAHTSPISALCFDQSGTLLVTASVHGNNINIFRIMPSCIPNRSGSQSYDWNSSHVHLYKLHRGITSAIIRDICFSHYSQWVTIVSSKGTCHIYVLSPFGGDVGLQALDSESEESSLSPVVSSPWWSNLSCTVNQQSYQPPSPVTLSVVSRIRDTYSGWLSSVSNATASGKGSIPSGAVAAVFYNSTTHSLPHVNHSVKSLEHLLVYTPSGHVIQYELLPSTRVQVSETASKIQSGSYLQTHDEYLRVKIDPIQWWDVCRRSDWPEKGENIFGTTFDRPRALDPILGVSDRVNNHQSELLESNNNIVERKLLKIESINSHEKSHWYLSNAEVQISSNKVPLWQKSKISFCVIAPQRVENYVIGEFEIEQLTVHEVEIRRRDLLPVFDHFHGLKLCWNDRGLDGGRYPNGTSLLELHQVKEKFNDETSVICHSNPASLSSTESSDGGSSRRNENLLDLDQIHSENSYTPTCQISGEFSREIREIPALGDSSLMQNPNVTTSFPSNHLKNNSGHVKNKIIHRFSSLDSNSASAQRAVVQSIPPLNSPGLKADYCHSTLNMSEEGPAAALFLNPVIFEDCFQEEYCKASDLEENNVNSSDKRGMEKLYEGEEQDEMFGGMFAFSEEG